MQKVFDCYSKKEIIDYETNNSYRYTQYGEMVFKNRFLLDSNIATIDEDSMKEIFSSIIIEKKAKKRILSDLQILGIENSFVYPELEYTA